MRDELVREQGLFDEALQRLSSLNENLNNIRSESGRLADRIFGSEPIPGAPGGGEASLRGEPDTIAERLDHALAMAARQADGILEQVTRLQKLGG